MTNLDINTTIILITLFVVYGIFLFFDIFQRNERYRYLAYIVALFPVNYMWILQFDIILVYIILFILWIFSILRDIILVYRKTKNYNDIFLFLILAVLIQFIVAAVLPGILTDLQSLDYIAAVWYFYLPDIYAPGVNSNYVLIFRILITSLILLVMGPLLLDVRGEEIPFPVLIVIVAIFIVPFLILSFVWLPEAIFVLPFLFSVILLIVLLIITRSGKETKIKK